MGNRIRLFVLTLALSAAAWLAAPLLSAQEKPAPEGPDRSSPRALFNTFFGAINDVDQDLRGREGTPEWRAARDAAVQCLDPGVTIPAGALSRPEALLGAARKLKQVLDYGGRIEIGHLPGPEYEEATFSYGTSAGPILCKRGDDGAWFVSYETMAALDTMLAEFRASGARKYERRTLRKYVPDSLRGRALFLEHWQWLGIVGLILLCWIVDRVVVFFSRGVIARLLERSKLLKTGAKIAHQAARPFGFFAIAALLWTAHPFLDLPPKPFEVAAKLVASMGAILIAFRVIDVMGQRMADVAEGTESKLDDQLIPLLRKSLKVLVFVGGVLFILDNLEMDITALLAGVSVAGLAVSFAARDTVANLFGSVTVFLDRPFHVGDWVVVAGVEGTVEEVGFRSTRVRTFYNSVVSVPNSKLVTSVVDNMGQREFRRFKTMLGVQYDTPPERLEAFVEGIRKIVLANPWMRHDVFEVHLNGFGPSSLDILIYTFFKVPGWHDELRQRQNFIVEILRLARELGVEFAFPTQTLHMSSTPGHPAPEPKPLTEEESWEIAESFGAGGARSRPDGTPRFAPGGEPPAPPSE